MEWVKDYFESHPDTSYVVKVMDVGGNTKALNAALQHVKGLDNKAALLMTVDQDKVSHMCIVSPQLIHKGLKASEWASIISNKVGGKSGGNDSAAQGAGNQALQVDEAILLANEFAKKCLLLD